MNGKRWDVAAIPPQSSKPMNRVKSLAMVVLAEEKL